ncbi:50S ribosomal protein L18 [bacterium]|nr:50S ribosomal protein L18 [bacterium]
MNKDKKKVELRKRRHQRVRSIIKGTKDRPRLNVFFSLKHIFVQLIDDQNFKTLASVSDKELKKHGNNSKIAEELGKSIAIKAQEQKIKQVVFDKNHYKYHGKVKALADAARKEGLIF